MKIIVRANRKEKERSVSLSSARRLARLGQSISIREASPDQALALAAIWKPKGDRAPGTYSLSR